MKKIVMILLILSFTLYGHHLKVGVFQNYPLVYTENDIAKGFLVDILDMVGEEEDWDIEYIEGTWSEHFEGLKNSKIDIMLSMAYTEEREKYFEYNKETAFTLWTQVYSKSSYINTIFDLKGKTVVLMKDDYNAGVFREMAKKYGVKYNEMVVGGYEESFEMVKDGKADAAVVVNTYGNSRKNRFSLKSTPIMFNPFSIYFAAKKGKNRDKLGIIDKYISEWKKDSNSYYYSNIDFWFGKDIVYKPLNFKAWYYLVAVSSLLLLISVALVIAYYKNSKLEAIAYERLKIKLKEERKKQLEIKAKYEESGRAKSQFLANMSHEIRTPMNGVLGMLEILEMTELNDVQKEYIWDIKDSAKSLLNIINDILDISKIEAGKQELMEEILKFEDFLNGAVSMFAAEAFKKKIELIVYSDPNIPEYLKGDFGKVKQILVNLISNAIKFTDKGEVLLKAEVKKDYDESIIINFIVKDTGIGIKAEKIDKIFEIFTQGDISYTKKYQGTGLGLSITKKLVDFLGGKIEIESSYGEGTVFRFELGFDKIMEDKEIDSKCKNRKALVLLKDKKDETLIQSLEKEEMTVIKTEDEEELLSVLEKEKAVEVIVFDIGIGDYEYSFLIKKMQFLLDMKKVMLIALGDSDDEGVRKNLYGLGVKAYFIKPLNEKEIVYEIKESLKDIKTYKYLEKYVKSRYTILLAEDNEINLKAMGAILENRGYRVIEAKNGAEVLDIFFNSNDIDMIFMDIQMPVLSGYDAAIEIRKKNMIIPIIALTAYAMESDKQKCIEAGINDYIVKPVSTEAIYSVSDKYLK